MLFWCVVTNLSFRDQLPEALSEKDKSADENSILVTLIMCHILNYTSFLATVLLQPAIILVSYYFQLQKQGELYHDPYNPQEPAWDDQQRQDWKTSRLVDMLMITMLITAHHYTTQRNMIRQMIKQHFISQQQTQMQKFFASEPEPVVVISSGEGESQKDH